MHVCLLTTFIALLHAVIIKNCNCIETNQIPDFPNVLIIIIDDLRQLENEKNNFPNINDLAGKSINFKNAFAQQALCAPSRNSLLTGRRPDSIRLYDFYSYWRETVGNFTTLPQLFKENSYHTYSVGKVFHPGASSGFTDDYPYSWTTKPYHPPADVYKDQPVCYDSATKKLQKNLICPIEVLDQPLHTLPDIQSLNRAINILKKEKRRKQKKPFLLAVGFHKPHIPLKFPKEYLDKYPLDRITPRARYCPKDMPLVAYHPWMDIRERDDIKQLNLSFPFSTIPYQWARRIIQAYYASVSYVDDLIGALINNVDFNDTIIVLTSDHGWSLGENGLWAKYSNFDAALKVPLLFYIPNWKPRDIYTPVELLDIFPTLAHVVGFKNIPKCNGDRLKLCFDGKNVLFMENNDNDIALSQYPRPSAYPKLNSDKPRLKDIKIMGYTLRSKRFRYTEWIGFNNTNYLKNWGENYGTELYDHVFDKYESNNLFDKPLYSDLVKQLSVLLRNKNNVNRNYVHSLINKDENQI